MPLNITEIIEIILIHSLIMDKKKKPLSRANKLVINNRK